MRLLVGWLLYKRVRLLLWQGSETAIAGGAAAIRSGLVTAGTPQAQKALEFSAEAAQDVWGDGRPGFYALGQHIYNKVKKLY